MFRSQAWKLKLQESQALNPLNSKTFLVNMDEQLLYASIYSTSQHGALNKCRIRGVACCSISSCLKFCRTRFMLQVSLQGYRCLGCHIFVLSNFWLSSFIKYIQILYVDQQLSSRRDLHHCWTSTSMDSPDQQVGSEWRLRRCSILQQRLAGSTAS